MKKNIYLIIISLITVVCIIFGALVHIGGLFKVSLPGKNATISESILYDADTAAGKSVSLDNLNALNINTKVIDVTIISGERFIVSYNGSERLKPDVDTEGSALMIRQPQTKPKYLFGFHSEKCAVTITVPSDQTMKKLALHTDVGDINIGDVQFDEADISANVGDLDLKDSILKTILIRENTGDVDIRNCSFESMDIDSDVGDVDITTDQKIALSEYNLNLETDLGDVSVGGDKSGKSYQQKADGPSLTIRNHVGDVEVQ